MPSIEPKRLRAVERLAYKMYEASDTAGIPWLRRGWTVRAVWLKKARERLQGADASADRLARWWNVWGKIKLIRL